MLTKFDEIILASRVRPWSLEAGPLPKNYLRRVGLVLKISSRSFHSIKFLIWTDRETDRQTDSHTDRPTDGQTDRQRDRQTDRHMPIYRRVKFLCPFDSFHITMIALLTQFMKNKLLMNYIIIELFNVM
jgi:hypothetical protein